MPIILSLPTVKIDLMIVLSYSQIQNAFGWSKTVIPFISWIFHILCILKKKTSKDNDILKNVLNLSIIQGYIGYILSEIIR